MSKKSAKKCKNKNIKCVPNHIDNKQYNEAYKEWKNTLYLAIIQATE